MNNLNIQYIGIGGVARSGKNLFAELLIEILHEKYNLKARQFALADALKSDCAKFLDKHFKLDVYSQKTEEKDIFRGMLVWYGDAKRKQSEGRHWIETLDTNIISNLALDSIFDNNTFQVAIVTDIRYDYYPRDEIHWMQSEKNGTVIHIERIDENLRLVLPANEHEQINDPKIKRKANIRFAWPTVSRDKAKKLVEETVSELVESGKLIV